MYGYNSGESTPKLQFGLNQGFKLTKFEFNANGGKDNALQDVLDIVFTTANGSEISYRQFPVERAYENNVEITDPKHPAMKKAFGAFNAKVSQVVGCFLTEDEIKEALEGVASFKDFCYKLANTLPDGYQEQELDVFGQYQWQPRGEETTKYLEIPKKVNMGKVFVPHVEGDFEMITVTEEGLATLGDATYQGVEDGANFDFTIGEKTVSLSKKTALAFVDMSGEEVAVHPFRRNHWFAASNWNKKSNDEVADEVNTGW